MDSVALDLLFIGGTGVISSACVAHAAASGHRVTVLNRGSSSLRPVPRGVEVLSADVRDLGAVRTVLGSRSFDAVADFLSFTAAQVASAVDLYRGRSGQYVFVSSASAYQKPPARLPILESTPLRNPFWQYSRDKIAGEEVLVQAYRADGFPGTVVRPSHTYDATMVPLIGHWTDIHRMRAGLPVVVHGDGTSLWTLTHSRDFAKAFVPLLGRPEAVGESYTITSDEFLPWDAVYRALAAAAGVSDPTLVHVASETIAAADPVRGPGLLGDKSHSLIFDNSKIKSLVPQYRAVIPFAAGAREIVDWYDAHPEARSLDSGWMELSDRLAGQAREAGGLPA